MWPWVRRLIGVVVLSTLLFLAPPASSPLHAQRSGTSIEDLVNDLSRLPSLRASDTAALMAAIGYTPSLPQNDWKALSPREQLEIAVRSAEAGNPPGGRLVVAKAAQFYARTYDSVRFDARLAPLLNEGAAGNIHYAALSSGARGAPLSPALHQAVDALVPYVHGAGPFGRVNVLRDYLGLKTDVMEPLLHETDPHSMLRNAIRLVTPPPPAETRVVNLAEAVVRFRDSARMDPATREAVRELKRHLNRGADPVAASKLVSPPGTGMDNGGGGGGGSGRPDGLGSTPRDPSGSPGGVGGVGGVVVGGGGGGGAGAGNSAARRSAAVRRTAEFDARYYPTAASRGFGRVVARAGGRGGVVAGAPVTANGMSAKPSRILFELTVPNCYGGGGDTLGFLVIAMSDASVARYGPIACDEARVALEIVYGNNVDIKPWRPGEAIGLASIDPARGSLYFPRSGPLTLMGMRYDMLINPSLIDLDIGRVAAFSDLLPSAPSTLLRAAKADQNVRQWLGKVDRFATWRWHDAPMRITVKNGSLSVHNAADPRRTVVAMRMFSDQELGADAGRQNGGAGVEIPEFNTAIPVLVDRVLEYRRLDSLMRTLGLVRWAKLNGATLSGRLPSLAANRPPTPDNLVITSDFRIFALPRSPNPLKEACNALDARKPEIFRTLNSVSREMKALTLQTIMSCRMQPRRAPR